MNCNFVLVLVFAGILCCTAQSGDSISGPFPQHDYFKLALVWPNSYCVTDDRRCRSVLPQYFTIKAFWAELRDGKRVENCEILGPIFTEATISKYKTDMVKYWPDLTKHTYEENVQTWKKQWQQYGTCAADVLSPEDYLTNTLQLRQSHHLLNILRESGIVPDGTEYSSDKILSAIQRYTGTSVDIVCGMDKEGYIYLSEIHQCLDNTAKKFIDCGNRAIKCFADPIFAGELNYQAMKVRNASTTFKKQATETHA